MNPELELETCGVCYDIGSTAPDWWTKAPKQNRVSATSGSSHSNEWYVFKDEQSLIDWASINFISSRFIEDYIFIDDSFYLSEECIGSEDGIIPISGAKPACIQELVNSESNF